MGYDISLTATLTGATVAQLQRWRRTGLLVPEASASRPVEYSFRDLVALRTIAKLRAQTSLQQIRKAFSSLSDFDMVDHPSKYQFATDGKTVKVWTDDGFMNMSLQGMLWNFTRWCWRMSHEVLP
ncbi:helix-turn-helix domain-containing protein [Corynebacterium silvaticum]|uniref:Helix-turn-helix domain-containing protein n=1 Tax=Corynebacterium silvaticum TaxID=2320431 RepID=A0ACD4PYC6_9CORY|nr:helix-turn-helix domain-containing protein [Corynebacterium silvaticum]WCV10688.1 helix-turn-helix domain-containing protein [Corynebacterium silvaticum]